MLYIKTKTLGVKQIHVGEEHGFSEIQILDSVDLIQFDRDEMDKVSTLINNSILFQKRVGFLVGDLAKIVLLNW